MTPSPELIEKVARAICKSRTCEGAACCEWPANMARRSKCPVTAGAYDDAALFALAALPEEGRRSMESAPKDGTRVLLFGIPGENIDDDGRSTGSKGPTPIEVGWWNPKGTSWVDRNGTFNGAAHHLAETGTWFAGGGWFQPNEVTHWMELPSPPPDPQVKGRGPGMDQTVRP